MTLRPPPTVFPRSSELFPRVYKSPELTECDMRFLLSKNVSEPRTLYECIFSCRRNSSLIRESHPGKELEDYKKTCRSQCYRSFGVDNLQKVDNYAQKCDRFFDLAEYLEEKLGTQVVN